MLRGARRRGCNGHAGFCQEVKGGCSVATGPWSGGHQVSHGWAISRKGKLRRSESIPLVPGASPHLEISCPDLNLRSFPPASIGKANYPRFLKSFIKNKGKYRRKSVFEEWKPTHQHFPKSVPWKSVPGDTNKY